VTIYDVHLELAKDLLGPHPSDEDALAVMIVFHTYKIHLKGAILEDRKGVAELAAITQRHAAEAIARAWPDRSDGQRVFYNYWYFQYNARTPYEVIEDIPPAWMVRVEQVREKCVGNPRVFALEPED